MKSYLLDKILQLAFVLVGISLIVFVAMRLVPGDVAQLLAGEQATPADIERIRTQLGLNEPIWVQYYRFATSAVVGDFAPSIRSGKPALQDVLHAFPVTLQLALCALIVTICIGIPLGILASLKPGSVFDEFVLAITLFGGSVPVFWLGLMLLLAFGSYLGWLPLGGLLPIGVNVPRVTGMTIVDSFIAGRPDLAWISFKYIILPAITLGTVPVALVARITRAEMISIARLDHVRTARAKGLAERKITLHHVLHNAMIPVVTVIGLQAGVLLSGAVLTETIYSIPGLGRLMVDAILSRDYPIVEAGAIFIAFIFVIVNLLTDLCYGFLDPRIRRL
ncbi:Dipeptide transport system permease protein DppB [Hyphomicrobiales bacterium]|nr:Dipeptide transport system permease protein DppB [Hyphomicrobiales bacterium]CAH1692862.1 Dipeptide transport system permease protein DppB [Hyphomicrobiales bacterium]